MPPRRATKRGGKKNKKATASRGSTALEAAPGATPAAAQGPALVAKIAGGAVSYPRQHVLEKMDDGMRVAVQSALASHGVHLEAIRFVDDMRQLEWKDRAVVEGLEPLLERLRHKAVRHKRVEVVDVSNVWLYLVSVHDDFAKRHSELVRQHRMATALLPKATGRVWTARAAHLQRLEAGVKRIERDAETYNGALRIFTITKMAKQVEILRDTRFTQVGGATGEYLRRPDEEVEDHADMADAPLQLEGASDVNGTDDAVRDQADAPAPSEMSGKLPGAPSVDPSDPSPPRASRHQHGRANPSRIPPESGFGDLDTLNAVVDQFEPSFEEVLAQEKLLMAQYRLRDAGLDSGSDSGSNPLEDEVHGAASPNGSFGDDDSLLTRSSQSRGKVERDRKRRRRKAAEAAAVAASAAAACRAAAIIAEADASIGEFAGKITDLAGRAKRDELRALAPPEEEQANSMSASAALLEADDPDAGPSDSGRALAASQASSSGGDAGPTNAAAITLHEAGQRAAAAELGEHGQILKAMARDFASNPDTAWLDDVSQIDAQRLAQLLTDTVVSHVEGVADREVLGTMVKGADGKCHTIETEVIRRLLRVSIDDLQIRHTNLPRAKVEEIKREAGIRGRK